MRGRSPESIPRVLDVALIRNLSVIDLHAVLSPAAAVIVAAVGEVYEAALAKSGLTGPVSSIQLSLLPPRRPTPDELQVLVYCDRPDGFEILTCRVDEGLSRLSEQQVGRLVADLLQVGLARLATARSWPRDIVAAVAQIVEQRLPIEVGEATRPYRVIALGRGLSAPEQPHEIRNLGGEPMNDVPKLYEDEVSRLLREVAGPDWAHWWSHSPVKTAEVHSYFDVTEPRVRVRVGKRVSVTIERPVRTFGGAADPVRLAGADVAEVVAILTERLGLPDAPRLSSRPSDPDLQGRLAGRWEPSLDSLGADD